MRLNRFAATAIMAVAVFVTGTDAQQKPNVPAGVLLEPLGTTGEAVFPAFEGFGPLKDGTNTLLIGYFSRNKEAVDVPIGPDNRIEPGGPDFGQPTHFLSGRGSAPSGLCRTWCAIIRLPPSLEMPTSHRAIRLQ